MKGSIPSRKLEIGKKPLRSLRSSSHEQTFPNNSSRGSWKRNQHRRRFICVFLLSKTWNEWIFRQIEAIIVLCWSWLISSLIVWDWLVGCSEVSHHSSKPRPSEEEEEKRPAMELLRGFLPLGAAVWQCVVHGDTSRQCFYIGPLRKTQGVCFYWCAYYCDQKKLFTTETIRWYNIL